MNANEMFNPYDPDRLAGNWKPERSRKPIRLSLPMATRLTTFLPTSTEVPRTLWVALPTTGHAGGSSAWLYGGC